MKRIISILLCLLLMMELLAGCSAAHTPEAYTPTGEALAKEEGDEEDEDADAEAQSLSLAYYSSRTLNPLRSSDYTNRVIISLLYQSLFAVSRDYEVVPILCKSYSVTADMLTYEFTVDPKATFSDGTAVTAADVAASLKNARKNAFYSGRFRYVKSISATEAGTVRIRLTQAYENLPLLLDVPIVKASQVKDSAPLGSGPYVLGGTEENRVLIRRSDWWCESKDLLVTAKRIPLMSADSPTTIRDAFEFSDVGVVCTDPGSDRYVEYRCDYELWDCETGIFLYLGVNTESNVLKKKGVRRAISKGIDRAQLVDQYYRGFAVPAELPASPNSPYYAEALAQEYAYDAEEFISGSQSIKGKTITLLVNRSDTKRVKVAQEIGRMLGANGLIVTVVQRNPDKYEKALEEGNYDLYLGQTKLSPNMDLTPFFSASGALNYGKIDDIAVYNLCLQALENQGNFYTLHQTVMNEGYLCPILFRSYAVYAARGLMTQLQPSRDNVFCYSVGRTLTDAYTAQGA